MPTFSIIVPIYNAEKTLHRCLNSLLDQNYHDYEVLMIENGSGDASNSVCREYAARDSRFILYECGENKGPSGARTVGLDHASGTYIAFLDSDDYVDPDYLTVLLDAFSGSDVVFFGYHQVSVNGEFLGDHIPQIAENADYYETLIDLHRHDLFGYTWIKAFRRKVIGPHRFSRELNLLEDEVFACEVMAEPRNVKVVSKAILNYVTGNAGSLIGRTHPDYCRKIDVAYCAWKKLLETYEKRDEILAQMANAHVSRCMYYGFERDVDARAFFIDLANSAFFADSTQENVFMHAVQSRNYGKISRMRAGYRLRNVVATLLKR